MILKIHACCPVLMLGLFFNSCHLFCSSRSYKDFRDRCNLKVAVEKSEECDDDDFARLPLEPLCIARSISLNQEHIIKKALYNNRHQTLEVCLKPGNVDMVLSHDAQTSGHETLLMYACRSKKMDAREVLPDEHTIKILFKKHANPFCCDDNGNTALINAAQINNHEACVSVVQALISYAQNLNPTIVKDHINHLNKDGKSALMLAKEHNNQKLVGYLQNMC